MLMYLVHERLGKMLSWTVYEQNLLLTEGWREVSVLEFREHPGPQQHSFVVSTEQYVH
jgi:hypothetical protein